MYLSKIQFHVIVIPLTWLISIYPKVGLKLTSKA